jgi:hypothetical protein
MPPTLKLPSATITPHEIGVNGVTVFSQPRVKLVAMVLLDEGCVMALIRRDAKRADRQHMWKVVIIKQFLK